MKFLSVWFITLHQAGQIITVSKFKKSCCCKSSRWDFKNVPIDTSWAAEVGLAEMAVAAAGIVVGGIHKIHKIKHEENPILTEKDFSREMRPFFFEHRAYIGSALASLSCS